MKKETKEKLEQVVIFVNKTMINPDIANQATFSIEEFKTETDAGEIN